MRIGIFGGTFNPIHKGHISLAQEAKRSLELDEIIFIPAYIPPHKSSRFLLHAHQRCILLRLALKSEKSFRISLYEIEQRETVYSIDTIRHLKKKYPKDSSLFFLTGADSLIGLSRWRDIDELLELCNFVVFSRPGFIKDIKDPRIKTIDFKALDISSTEIRKKLKKNESIKGLVPVAVERYIKANGLFNE
jgi:nicotinate-nucleotide adenylyltransferase